MSRSGPQVGESRRFPQLDDGGARTRREPSEWKASSSESRWTPMTKRIGSAGTDAKRGMDPETRTDVHAPTHRHRTPCHRNEVRLVGRVSSPLQKRELPSGDVVGVVRIVVERGPGSRVTRPGATRAAVDAIDCAGWSPQAHAAMEHWQVGDVVEIGGALRRRFYRSGPIVSSRYEVEVSRGRRLTRARREERRSGGEATSTRRRVQRSTFVEPIAAGGKAASGGRAGPGD